MAGSGISERIVFLNRGRGLTGKLMSRNLFKSRKKESTVDIVINSVRQLLLSKKLLPGQKIPSENEICDGLGVSRGSVREAMKILAAFGIVEIKVGDGTYIPTEPKPAIIDPLLFSFLIHDPDIQEIVEFRQFLELDVIELILAHKDHNARERELIEENLEQLIGLRKMRASRESFGDNDMEFHRLLGRASGNQLMRKIYEFALDFLENTIRETHDHQEYGAVSYEVHAKIVEAIRRNDLELARQAVFYSVDVWRTLQTDVEDKSPKKLESKKS